MTATPTTTRIGVLGVVFGAGLAAVLLHLWFLMVHDHEAWARLSHENRWSFKSVPSRRGALLDRFGRVLAHDEPTTELAVHYVRFRLRHPVGAAVHGATTWANLQPLRAGTTYDYLAGELGPEAAARELLAMPAALLRPRALPKNVASELASAVTTVLAACSGQTRRRVFAALREAAQSGRGLAVGDVLTVPREELLAAFSRSFAALLQLEHDVRASAEARLRRSLTADDDLGLVATLELLRRASLAGTQVTWQENGQEKKGSKIEEVRRAFAQHVPFDLAAQLRVASERFPGLDVLPSVARRRQVDPDSALHVLLGNVVAIDRTEPRRDMEPPKDLSDPQAVEAYRTYLDDKAAFHRFLNRDLPSDWLVDLEPPEDEDATDAQRRLQREATDYYTRELRVRGRRGVTGLERAFDETLTGRLGVRLVEHDAKRREQQLWSHLRVEAGEDVRVTLDVDLQRVAEDAARSAWQRQQHGDERDRIMTEAAIAILDARTGDVLAYAGAPILSAAARDVPGVAWLGNGSLGSVVKPFVLVEQLQSESVGRPHLPIASLAPCNSTFRHAGTDLKCGHAHWAGGQDPIEALAQSCNLFFYQCAVGLGEEGVTRALQRFGLAASAADEPFAACWQMRVPGIPATPPDNDVAGTLLPRRAIGYGVAASPLHVARAYAALATGYLPTVGLRPVPRPRVALDDVAGEIVTVEKGLQQSVLTGTASKLRLLAELGVLGKTGTAEIGRDGENNAWFAGYLPPLGQAGTQLCFCAVVYWVEDGRHGGDAAGQLVVDVLEAVRADTELHTRYLAPEGGR